MDPQQDPATVAQLRVESLVHGGEALARHQGQVVFLRGAAPGDLVLARLDAPRGERFLRGRVLRVLERGFARVDAPCPIVERCGGCPIQQVTYAEQLRAKHALVVDALTRQGGLSQAGLRTAPVVPSPAQLRYRRRARLHRGPDGSWGFSSGEAVVPVAECLLFTPALQTLADAVRAQIERLGGLPGVTDLGLDSSDSGKGAIDLRTDGPPSSGLRKKSQLLLDSVPQLRGVVLGPQPGRAASRTSTARAGPLLLDGEAAKELLGDPVLADAPESLPRQPAAAQERGAAPDERAPREVRWRLRSRPDLFAQANRAAVPLLQAAVLEALGDAGEGRLLELFCGAGTLTLPVLARGGAVLGVESAGPSLALLRRSADESGLSPRLRLYEGDAAKVARSLLAEESGRLDAVLLDPPRTGALDAIRAAAALRPRRIVYVSCDAPTLGRDANELARLGYVLARAVPLDLFPQTGHLEVIAQFERSTAPASIR